MNLLILFSLTSLSTSVTRANFDRFDYIQMNGSLTVTTAHIPFLLTLDKLEKLENQDSIVY